MVWYVYDKNRAGDPVSFKDRAKALEFKVNRAAMTGGDYKIRWCHPESVPVKFEIQ